MPSESYIRIPTCAHFAAPKDIPISALKPGWVIRVNWVTFCPGQTQFKNYPGLTWIGSCEMQNKESTIWNHNNGCHCNVWFMSRTHFSKQWYLLHGEPCPCMQQLPFTVCSELRPLICCCCRSSTPAVCQGIFMCSRLIACTKPLPPIQATFLCLQAYR